jgi:hypothetical protein
MAAHPANVPDVERDLFADVFYDQGRPRVPPSPLTGEREQAIFHDFRTQMSQFCQVGVCIVCDTWQRAPHLKEMPLDQLPIANMYARLAPPPDLLPGLVEQYECTQLPGLMLSRKGFVGADRARICQTCLASLRKRDANDKPPKLAIRNGLYIGCLPPQFAGLTDMEVATCALTHNCHFITTVYGGGNNVLRSHSYTVVSNPGPIATILPRNLRDEDTFQVALVGSLTRDQDIAARAFHQVRHPLVRDFLFSLAINNVLYADVAFGEERVAHIAGRGACMLVCSYERGGLLLIPSHMHPLHPSSAHPHECRGRHWFLPRLAHHAQRPGERASRSRGCDAHAHVAAHHG